MKHDARSKATYLLQPLYSDMTQFCCIYRKSFYRVTLEKTHTEVPGITLLAEND